MDQNKVTLCYRGEMFNRLKVKNNQRITEAISGGNIRMEFNTQPCLIEKQTVTLQHGITSEKQILENDLVYIFAGGELPTQFLQKIGIQITKKFGDTILKH
jgi:thioredoxin reductase